MVNAMQQPDQFSSYHDELLDGRYDCVDRLVLNGYFPLGQQGGGFRFWWRQLTGSDDTLDQEHLLRMAGRFSRRVHTWAHKHDVPIIHCVPGERKHELAEKYLPQDPNFQGLFLILVAKAPALAWDVKCNAKGVPHLECKNPWPYVNHYHFHIIDSEWGHLTIKMSGHPPFGIQVMVNGHEWVERQARKQTISIEKEGNCFTGGSFQALDRVADTLCEEHAIGRLTEVCDRWVYSSCLCFALDLDEQQRSNFRYRYSAFQIEFSRNLLFTRGTTLDAVFQGLIDRTRRYLDVPKLRTIFGYRHRPHQRHKNKKPRISRVLDTSTHDLTVFKVHFGLLTLKIYDKGGRILRIEVIAHNVKWLRCGKVIEKLPIMLAKLQRMVIDFLDVVQAANYNYLPDGIIDSLVEPTIRGARRLAGVDLQKPRMRTVTEAILTLAPKPDGFTMADLATKVSNLLPDKDTTYTSRHAAYDFSKLRGKNLVERVEGSRHYRVLPKGIRILAGMLTLREKVIKPVIAGLGKPRVGRPLKTYTLLTNTMTTYNVSCVVRSKLSH
uniref:Uncharacterized protein n=1 Tax=Candidatus Kentrum sp. DK TaxID=2126562 RepID=A0A450TQ44_9GAMM|nr:MAG: hypothetical protein BECKDK2373B_GA0170837_12681 [Candidatus Kentron sp. DK]